MPDRDAVHTLLASALRHHLDGDLATAESLYRDIIRLAPDEPQAKHYLGYLLQQTDRLAEAVEQLTCAIQLDDHHAEWHFNLGIALSRQGLISAAIDAYTCAIAIDPDKYFYWTNLGTAFESSPDWERAEQCYQTASTLNPDYPDAYYLLSALYLKQERYPEARHSNYCGIIADPAAVSSRIVLGQAYYELGRIDDAIAVFENWLLAEPDNPVATHLLTAYRGQHIPRQCTSQYIEQTFDAFANSFDKVLDRLQYCGPQLVHDYVAALGIPAASLSVLDLGCGTGLVGKLVAAYAVRLVGVDLSQAMLEQATATQVYQQLHKADIADFLAASSDRFDLISCMDTFIYLGRLDEVLKLIYHRLNSGGMLICSTEKLVAANELGYQLNISGRYSHHQDYLINMLGNTGFHIRKIEDVPIRTEAGCPIAGQFICASRMA